MASNPDDLLNVVGSASSTAPLRVMIVAGEASGEVYGADLMRELRARSRRAVLFRGIGGDAMRAEGAELLCHCDQTAVVGIVEVAKHWRFFVGLLRRMVNELRTWKPDLLLTIDYPGFNLQLAARAKALGIRTVHYISPQVWVWRRNRIHRIARVIDQLITIFPFEPACYEPTPLRPIYAGHPLVDRARKTLAQPEQPLPWGEGTRIALLPGSRAGEIRLILPALIESAVMVEERVGKCAFLIPAVSASMKELVGEVLSTCPRRPPRLGIVDGQAREVLRQARAAGIASGTATLEASLMRCPAVLVYRTSFTSYWILRVLLRKASFVGLVNIVCGRAVMPELLQDDMTPANIADHIEAYLTNSEARAAALAGLDEANALLSDGGAAARAAELILAAFPKQPTLPAP